MPLKADLSIDLEKIAESGNAEKTRVIFLTNPNNPTGRVISKRDFDAFLSNVPVDVVVVLDEAYIEFNTNPDTPSGFDYICTNGPGVVVLRTFSKAYGLARPANRLRRDGPRDCKFSKPRAAAFQYRVSCAGGRSGRP